MTLLSNIQTPTLLLDKHRALKNLERMVEKACRSNVLFRPHFKTHQSAEIGQWFRDAGVTSITVSSLLMAEYFADHGWDDITVAFLVNPLEIGRIRNLSKKIQLNLIVESAHIARLLQHELEHPVQVWIDIDTGYGRTGINWDDEAQILHIAEALIGHDLTNFKGLLTHAGHTYIMPDHQAKIDAYQETHDRMMTARNRLVDHGFNDLEISVGDTPGCSVVEDFGEVSEVRPGNFIFYDWSQHRVGSCKASDIAVAMACPIISRHPERQSLVMYGGGVHFSKDSYSEVGKTSFGVVVPWENDHWGQPIEETNVTSLSQEHGIIEFNNQAAFDNYNVGDVILVLPIHSCMTADKMGRYLTLDGETISMMRI